MHYYYWSNSNFKKCCEPLIKLLKRVMNLKILQIQWAPKIWANVAFELPKLGIMLKGSKLVP